ncbi:MAG: hypothetical protein R2824_08690 [Saprospiraceae bacterium]|nr:hypothetical protein [Lewinella sp.]
MEMKIEPLERKRETLAIEVIDVQWRISFPHLLRLLIPGVLLLIFFSLPQFDRTPFIDTFQDLIHPSARWLFPDGPHLPENSERYLSIGILYTVLLAYFFYQLYFTFSSNRNCQKSEEGNTKYKRELKTQWFYLEKGLWANIIFGLFLLLSLDELILIYTRFECEAFFESNCFLWLSHSAFFVRTIGISIAIYAFLKTFFNDFLQSILLFLKKFLSYFYPSIIAITVLGVVLANMDQMDSLFIDLINSPLNFLAFCLFLFPASLIIIWFGPIYLQFTDHQFEENQEETRKSFAFLITPNGPDGERKSRLNAFKWLYSHKRKLVRRDSENNNVQENKNENKDLKEAPTIPKDTLSFHLCGMAFGATYIITLINITGRIYWTNSGVGATWFTLLSVLSPILAFLYVWFAWRQLSSGARPKKEQKNKLGIVFTKFWAKLISSPFWYIFGKLEEYAASRYFIRRMHKGMKNITNEDKEPIAVKSRWPLLIFIIAVLICVILFLVSLSLILFHFQTDNLYSWRPPFAIFLAFVAVSLFAFLGMAFYRIFFQRYQFEAKVPSRGFMDALDYVTTTIVLAYIPILAVVAFVFFVIGLCWTPFLYSDSIHNINPLNIYLLLINGLIAFVVLIDRSLLIWRHLDLFKPEKRDTGVQISKTDDQKELSSKTAYIAPKYQIWALLGLGVLLSQSFCGNSYNEIRYHERTSADQQFQQLSLETYVEGFVNKLDDLNKSSKKDSIIILIGADGGGLKAAYWTMLNLYRLDTMGLFDHHVFMSSGASGGAIGLGMYTYMKSLGMDTSTIRTKIDLIAEHNFLSGDFTGLLTRFPLRAWPDKIGLAEAHQFDDRMDAMAQAYFRLCNQGETDNFDFEKLRQEPFYKLWEGNPNLPLYVLNTSRSEDGMRGIVHPLQTDLTLTTGVVDLSSLITQSGKKRKDTQFISFPEALFLTNRFPVFSPAGKIQGRGSFIDAGAVENSGLATIYQFLEIMKHRAEQKDSTRENAFKCFFKYKIYILSIRNAKSRFVRDNFYSYLNETNRSFHVSDLNANINAALNSGLVGTPYFWDDRLLNKNTQPVRLYDNFLRIDLPFVLDKHDPHRVFGGQISDPKVNDKVIEINRKIYRHVSGSDDKCSLVMPPLGRLLADPVRQYMRKMVDYPDNEKVFEFLQQ